MWAQAVLQSRKVPAEDLINSLGYINAACKILLPAANSEIISAFIKKSIQAINNAQPLPDTCLSALNPLLPQAKQYLSFLLEGNRKQAQLLVLQLAKNGEPVSSIYENIFQAAQYEIGLLWQANKITVAHEHYCTAATQLIMSSLYPYIFETEKKGGKILACTVSGDLHEIGIRMISDQFEMNGWDSYYLGANMPDKGVISAIKEQQPDIVAISVMMPLHLSKAEKLIKKIKGDETISKVKIIVGGHPFAVAPALWSKIGADGCAQSAKDAITLAKQLILKN
jgi:methanogenic corrinoid protein MtbC1